MSIQSWDSLSESEFTGFVDTQARALNQDFVNEQHYRIAHLTSERGKQLNGKAGRLVGFSGATHNTRFHVEVDGEATLLLKKENLIPASQLKYINGVGEVTWAIDRYELHSAILDTIEYQEKEGLFRSRLDTRYRRDRMLDFIEQTTKKDGQAKPLKCLVSGLEHLPYHELSYMDRFLSLAKVACSGSTNVDFFNFTRALEPTGAGRHQLSKRLREFVISGMCEMCQTVIMESELGNALLPCIPLYTDCVD